MVVDSAARAGSRPPRSSWSRTATKGLTVCASRGRVPREALDPTLRLGAPQRQKPTPSQPLPGRGRAHFATALQAGVGGGGSRWTVDYTKDRVQFGRPIGSFQALKHRMADLLVLIEMSGRLRGRQRVLRGVRADPTGRADAAAPRGGAKAYCSDAPETVAGETVQLHGGIAITWEHDAAAGLQARPRLVRAVRGRHVTSGR